MQRAGTEVRPATTVSVPNKFRYMHTDGSRFQKRSPVGSCRCVRSSLTFLYRTTVHALELANSIHNINRFPTYVIFSDSPSALTLLQNLHYTHPDLRKIQHDLFTMPEAGQAVDFLWISCHAGIRGNEHADFLAKVMPTHQKQFITIHYRD